MRRTIMDIVEMRFTGLIDNVQFLVEHTNDVEKLRRILKELVVASNEGTVIRILNSLSAQLAAIAMFVPSKKNTPMFSTA